MSGEKIGSLTNNSCGGWGSKMQAGKYRTKRSYLLLSWNAWGGGGRAVHTLRGVGVGVAVPWLRGEAAWRGQRTLWSQQPGLHVVRLPSPLHAQVKSGKERCHAWH